MELRFADGNEIQGRVTAILKTAPRKEFCGSFRKLSEHSGGSLVAITPNANKDIFNVHSVFVFLLYHSPNFIDTPHILYKFLAMKCHKIIK